MARRMFALALSVVLIGAACGGDEASDGDATAQPTEQAAAEATTAVEDADTEADPEEPVADGESAGAFAVDLDGSRMQGVTVAGYGELNVHQVEATDSTVWVTVGDAANEGDAYVAGYDLAGAEIARVGSDGRPLGIASDPDGRGVWVGDSFNGNVDFIDSAAEEVGASVDDAVSSLSTTILNDSGSIWSLPSRDSLVRIDTASAAIVEEIPMPFESSQSDLLLADGTLWATDSLSDSVTAVDLDTGESRVFEVVSADEMVLLDTGMILVSGEQLVTIEPESGSITELGSVVYPDKNELFPARFTGLATTSRGLYGFDGVHGRLVRLDLGALTATVIDEVPIGFVGVGDLAESSDGTIWLVVTGEETDTDTEDHLRIYETG